MFKFYFIIFFLVLCSSLSINAQSQYFVINEIILNGNDHTKPKVVLKEINYQVGDSIYFSDLNVILDQMKFQILSTGLFNSVIPNIKNYNPNLKKADIEITLEENWYIFPVPIFELADRNFSVWWKEQGRSLSRVNYGFRVSHYNLTGNKDPLRLKIHFGYTRKYELTYVYPYLSKDAKFGIGGSIFYSENREIAFQTIGNKTQFAQLQDERKLLSRFRIGPELKYRPDPYNFHSLRFEFHHNQVDDYVITDLNPNYFLNNKTDLRFLFLQYDYSHDRRLYRHYPLGGYLYFLNLKKEGLGIFNDFNNLSLTIGVEQHLKLSNKLVFSTRNKAKANLTRSIVSFANNTGLGWDTDIVSGYDLYVMDGTDFIISINSLKLLLFDSNMNTVKWMPKQFRKMNLTVFLRANMDFAYVNERTYIETNTLNNRIIYGYGPAVDLIFFNNFIFSFEYSFNDIGERGLFFSNSIAF